MLTAVAGSLHDLETETGKGAHLSEVKGRKAETPAWALGLEIVGWVITGIAVVVGAVNVIMLLSEPSAEMMVILVPIAIAAASAGIFIGGIPIAIARAARRRATPAPLRLWAAILLRVAGLLCISFPLLIYGTLPAGLEVSRFMSSSSDSSSTISPLDPELLQGVVLVSGIPFALGLILVAVAVIWGRRKPQPDPASVFG